MLLPTYCPCCCDTDEDTVLDTDTDTDTDTDMQPSAPLTKPFPQATTFMWP